MNKHQLTKFINGETYVLKVCLVVGKRDGKQDGNPALLRIIDDDQTVHLAGDEEFWMGYFPEKMFK